ncbi:hypothetical protein [Virgisporangium aurantiacum]|nr:hypothetical protein [Virgisporangium aurantiacum]
MAAALYLGTLGLVGTASPPAAGAVAAEDCTYRISVLEFDNPLPRPPGGRWFSGFGQILGSDGVNRFAGWRHWSVTSPWSFGSVGVIWTGATEQHLEGTAAEPWATAFDVNGSGDAVGNLNASGAGDHAVLWRAGAPATPVRLAEPAGATSTTATAVDDNGVIVGFATFGSGTGQTTRGLTWSVSSPGTVRDLGATAGVLSDVGADGRVVGFTGRADAPGRAVAGPVTAVTPLPGQPGTTGGYAFATAGPFVVGRGAGTGPLRWENGVAQALPALAPGPNNFSSDPIPPAPAFPVAVNSAGLVVANTGHLPLDRLAGGIARASYLKDGEWRALPLDPEDVDLYGSNRAVTVTEDGRIGGTSSAADLERPAIWTCT